MSVHVDGSVQHVSAVQITVRRKVRASARETKPQWCSGANDHGLLTRRLDDGAWDISNRVDADVAIERSITAANAAKKRWLENTLSYSSAFASESVAPVLDSMFIVSAKSSALSWR
jgi:hypothetical protein